MHDLLAAAIKRGSNSDDQALFFKPGKKRMCQEYIRVFHLYFPTDVWGLKKQEHEHKKEKNSRT